MGEGGGFEGAHEVTEGAGGGGKGKKGEDLRGPTRLLKALVGEGREREVKEFYGLMKRDGCMPNEYLFGFLVRGLRRLGDEEGQRGLRMLGDEEGTKMVERDYEEWEVHGQWGRLRRGKRR
ncbi:uncharacterized protein A4U43_C01F31580 [Asparagus officinalis]|uniref:Pentacotripeptide-repeat region of PRORP domain-containing protein n=1 Tax=Asparagus officinalis TaxID=4686 RepID=A0A5P1FX48_ASPOF|nr:uncharacterized protein A4U43_C01F31580 [Asparagus officinalis]